MKSKQSQKSEPKMQIIGAFRKKTEDWASEFSVLTLPSTIYYRIDGLADIYDQINKIDWDLGENFITTVTKKHIATPIKNIYKNELSTLTVCASVYTDKKLYIPSSFYVSELKYKEKNNKKEFYIDPETFKNQIIQFYKDDILTDELALSLQKIVNGLGFHRAFINYTFKDLMIGDALVRLIKVLKDKKFDPDRGFNPFSYFSQIAYNVFVMRIKKENKAHEAFLNYRDQFFRRVEEDGLLPYSKNNLNQDNEIFEESFVEE